VAGPAWPKSDGPEPPGATLSLNLPWTVTDVSGKTERAQSPVPPFTTSTCSRSQSQVCGSRAANTMPRAQAALTSGAFITLHAHRLSVAPLSDQAITAAAVAWLIKDGPGLTFSPGPPPVSHPEPANGPGAH